MKKSLELLAPYIEKENGMVEFNWRKGYHNCRREVFPTLLQEMVDCSCAIKPIFDNNGSTVRFCQLIDGDAFIQAYFLDGFSLEIRDAPNETLLALQLYLGFLLDDWDLNSRDEDDLALEHFFARLLEALNTREGKQFCHDYYVLTGNLPSPDTMKHAIESHYPSQEEIGILL